MEKPLHPVPSRLHHHACLCVCCTIHGPFCLACDADTFHTHSVPPWVCITAATDTSSRMSSSQSHQSAHTPQEETIATGDCGSCHQATRLIKWLFHLLCGQSKWYTSVWCVVMAALTCEALNNQCTTGMPPHPAPDCNWAR